MLVGFDGLLERQSLALFGAFFLFFEVGSCALILVFYVSFYVSWCGCREEPDVLLLLFFY